MNDLQASLLALRPLPESNGQGLVNVTVDFELAWNLTPVMRGTRRVLTKTPHDAVREAQIARACFEPFVQLCRRHDIPITFACVGHLLLRRCTRDAAGTAHPEVPPCRPAWWPGGDWLSQDPATDLARDPLWYAPDLIEQILASPLPHEIGCHSFTHVDFSDPACTLEVAQAELHAFSDAARTLGIDRCTTFVFPRNRPGHVALLARHGFTLYRDADPAAQPRTDPHGLLAIPLGIHLNPFKYAPTEIIAAAQRAADLGAFLHLNLHLSEFEAGPAQARRFLAPIFSHLASLRAAGRAQLLTLRQAQPLLARPAAGTNKRSMKPADNHP